MQVAICDMIWINFMKDYLLNFIFQLRYLQTLNSISAENNSTVIFPVPIDIINSFMTPAPNNNMLPFQHYNFHQQFHKAHMMNVKQRPPLVPTHSKVSKVSRRSSPVGWYQKDDFLFFSNDLLQKVTEIWYKTEKD